MSTVEEIENAIEKLPLQERWSLHNWLSEQMADQWDSQIESDIKAGKLDQLAEEAIAEYRAGKTRPFPK
jgi:hypothetical protein